MKIKFFGIPEYFFTSATKLAGWWLRWLDSLLLRWRGCRLVCCIIILGAMWLLVATIIACLAWIPTFLLTPLRKWLYLWDSLPQWQQSLHVRSIGCILEFLKTKLFIDSIYYILTHLPNGTILVTQCLLQLAKDGIKWIGALDGLNVLAFIVCFQISGNFIQLLQPLLQMIMRAQGLNIEVTLFLHQKSQNK